MPADVTIYHNPRCSKSRATLELIRSRGVEPTIVEYLATPPSPDRIRELAALLGVSAHDLIRPKEPPYVELGLSKSSPEEEIVSAIATHPILLERPIVVIGKKAAIGRPPENVLRIL